MKSYVINLANRPERLEHIRREFGEAGIAFERFDAVDQRRAVAHQVGRRLPPLKSGREWQPFEIGCMLSHYEIWKIIAEGLDDFGAIFEDDVVIGNELRAVLRGAFPADADLVKLETVLHAVYLGRREYREPPSKAGFRRLLSVHQGTGAYIISRRCAELLTKLAPNFDEPLDHALFSPTLARRHGLKVYQTVPAPVVQGLFVQELRDTKVMSSDRMVIDPSQQTRSEKTVTLVARIIRRMLNHLRGRRTIVPFAG